MTRSAVFAPFEIVEGDRERGLVLLADHARRDLPEEYGDLGLPPERIRPPHRLRHRRRGGDAAGSPR